MTVKNIANSSDEVETNPLPKIPICPVISFTDSEFIRLFRLTLIIGILSLTVVNILSNPL